MPERLRSVLVDSYVGAIALGLLFAPGISAFANAVAAPVREWLQLRGNTSIAGPFSTPLGFWLLSILPELLTSVLLLLIAYALLRWLYYPAAEQQDQEQTPELEQGA